MFTPDQKNALTYDKHISLTANAGSGKTFVLTQRYLKIATEQSVPLRNIVAITFTELAAAELYHSIAEGIHSLITEAKRDEDRQRYEAIRKELVSANVSTIHSFCASLLREFPAEAGVDPGFSVLDQSDTIALIVESMKEILSSPENAAAVSRLSAVFGSRWHLESVIRQLLFKRENLAGVIEKFSASTAEQAAQMLSDNFCAFLETELNRLWPVLTTKIKSMNEIVLNAQKKSDRAGEAGELLKSVNTDTVSIDGARKLLAAANAVFLKNYTGIRSQGYAKGIAVEEFWDARIPEYMAMVELYLSVMKEDGAVDMETFVFTALNARAVLDLYGKVLAAFDLRKRKRGELDFTDMILCTRELLRDERVRTALAERFRYIMVDEYQDTNETQYEIFLPLLDYLKKGNLFVVGDDKQSIYMFRNADLEISARTRDEIKNAESGGSVHILPDSFRMAPELCLFINNAFSRIFSDANPAYNEVAHEETICAYREDSPGKIEILLSNAEEGLGDEAELLTRRILLLKREEPSLQWKDIAVLCRKRKYFDELQTSLSRYAVPFYINGTRGFYQSRVVMDVCNYITFLANPRDEAALIGVLRSPFYLLSDTDIFNISTVKRSTYFTKLQDYAASETCSVKIKKCAALLTAHLKTALVSQISGVLDRILSDTAYMTLIAARTDGEQLLVNLSKLRSLAMEYEEKGLRNLFEFAESLRASVEAGSDEADAPLSDSQDAVQIMTIHASKGLQFPAVFLYRMNDALRAPGGFEGVLLDKRFGVVSKAPGSADYFELTENTPLYSLTRLIRGKREAAEEKRLLYVALTRAKARLFLCLSDADKEKSGSFWSMLAPAAGLNAALPEIRIRGTVQRLRESNSEFHRETIDSELNIPVRKNIDAVTAELSQHAEQEQTLIHRSPISATINGSVLTATQFGTFTFCAMSYYLNYILKVKEFIVRPPYPTEKAEETHEDALPNIAAVRGTVLHTLLENGAAELNEERVREEFERQSGILMLNELKEYAEETLSILRNFKSSSLFSELNALDSYTSEERIQASHGGLYLQGRIDRLIRTEEGLIIVDYKSSANPAGLPQSTIDEYMQQLTFYAFLAKKLYPVSRKIELWLVFLRDPARSIRKECGDDDIRRFDENLNRMKTALLTGQFEKNSQSCPHCHFAKSRAYCAVPD